MKTCTCFGSDSEIVVWEAPVNHYGDKAKLLHICTRCGHTYAAWPNLEHADAEAKASSSSDDNTAL